MGTSFTGFGGHGFWSKDDTIAVWLYLLAQRAKELENPPEWLVAAREDWHTSATLGVTGCVSAYLDRYLISPERVALTLVVGERALAWLREQGPLLSPELLNSFGAGGEGSYFTKDLPTDVFCRVGDAFVKLLRGEIAWDESTSPMVDFST